MGKAKLPQLHLKLVKCQTWYLPFKTSLSCFLTAGEDELDNFCCYAEVISCIMQRYTYRVLQTIQIKLTLFCDWAEPAILGSTKTALKFKYEILIG